MSRMQQYYGSSGVSGQSGVSGTRGLTGTTRPQKRLTKEEYLREVGTRLDRLETHTKTHFESLPKGYTGMSEHHFENMPSRAEHVHSHNSVIIGEKVNHEIMPAHKQNKKFSVPPNNS